MSKGVKVKIICCILILVLVIIGLIYFLVMINKKRLIVGT